jgi:hypothetical protein
MNAPTIVTSIPLEAGCQVHREGRPQVCIEAEREGDEERLAEWNAAHPTLIESLPSLYQRAVAAADEMTRAA